MALVHNSAEAGVPRNTGSETPPSIPPMPPPPELVKPGDPITYNDVVELVAGITDGVGDMPFTRAAQEGNSKPADGIEKPLGAMPAVPPAELAAAMAPQSRIGRAIAKMRKSGARAAVQDTIHRARTVEITRRRFLRDSAGAVGFTALTAQAGTARYLLGHANQAMAEHWPANKPTLNFIGEVPKHPKELAIFFPGFGDIAGAEEAETLKAQGHIDPNVPVAYMDYSNQGPESIAQLAQIIRETVPDIDKVESITIVGRSLGGPIGLGVAALLGRPVKVFMSLASPYVPSDAAMARLGTTLARLPDDRLVDADIKYAIDLWNHANGDQPTNAMKDFSAAAMSLFEAAGGHSSFHQALNYAVEGLGKLSAADTHAWSDVWNGPDPLAQQHELGAWWKERLSTDPHQLNPIFLRGIRRVLIPGFTKFYYTATDHPDTDKTVNVVAGAYHWRDFMLNTARLHRRDIHIMGLPYNGHADMGVTVHSMAPMLRYETGMPGSALADASHPLPDKG